MVLVSRVACCDVSWMIASGLAKRLDQCAENLVVEHVMQTNVDRLADAITKAATVVDAATHELLTHIRAFDESGGWHEQGATSCAAWLTWCVGLTKGVAREKVRVARKLGALPLIDEALRRGQISYFMTRELSRVATPENEQELLDIARHTTGAQLEKICRMYRQVQGTAVPTERAPERWLHTRDTPDGMVRITAQLTPDEAALIMAAVDTAAKAASDTGDLADGLVAIAEHAARGDKPHRPPTEVVVHIDADNLTGQLDNGAAIPAGACHRLLCDAGIVPVLEDKHGNTLDVGRKSRSVPAALRRALALRDGGCRFPGCDHRRFMDVHHIKPWHAGGETSIDNTLKLCTHHHKMTHDNVFSIHRTLNGSIEFRDPQGHVITSGRTQVQTIPTWPKPKGPRAPGWDGSPIDYAYIVDSLQAQSTPPAHPI